jgi:hypothetical protein
MVKRALDAADRCPHCNGTLRAVGRGIACATCGREPSAAVAGGATAVAPSQLAPSRPCGVNGCPGLVRGSAPCECCARRAAYLEQHLPKRFCGICGGKLEGRGAIKYCKACKPVAARIAIKTAPSVTGNKKATAAR